MVGARCGVTIGGADTGAEEVGDEGAVVQVVASRQTSRHAENEE